MKGDQGLLTALALGFGLLTLIHIGADWLRSPCAALSWRRAQFPDGRQPLPSSGAAALELVREAPYRRSRLALPLDGADPAADLGGACRGPRRRRDGDADAGDDLDLQPDAVAASCSRRWPSTRVLRFALYRSLRQRQEEMIEAAAKEQTTFIETARAIQSIKIFGRESDREAVWQNRYAASISRTIRQGRFTIGFKTANDLIYGIENVLVVCLGATAIMANDMTIGMLYRLHGLQGAVPRQGHQPDRDRHPVPHARPASRPALRHRPRRARSGPARRQPRRRADAGAQSN